MGYGNRLGGKAGFGGGAKKGPRAHNGSFKNRAKLRPAPERQPSEAPHVADSEGTNPLRFVQTKATVSNDALLQRDEPVDTDAACIGSEWGQTSERKPLFGCTITVTGCNGCKGELLQLAVELGGKAHGSLTSDTTHLVADSRGSAKYEMALRHRSIKVMLPNWIFALRSAWQNGESISFASFQLQNAMPAFQGTVVSLSGFQRGPHRDNLISLLSTHGAEVTPNLHTNVTHLVVASPKSGHNASFPSSSHVDKLKQARARPKKVKIVWEGWIEECLMLGGIRTDREVMWGWNPQGQEPSEEQSSHKALWGIDPLQQTEFEQKRDFNCRRETGENAYPSVETAGIKEVKMLAVARGEGGELGEEMLPALSAHRKSRARTDNQHEIRAVENLIKGYNPESRPPVDSGLGTISELPGTVDENALGTRRRHPNGSVIKALTISRTSSFREDLENNKEHVQLHRALKKCWNDSTSIEAEIMSASEKATPYNELSFGANTAGKTIAESPSRIKYLSASLREIDSKVEEEEDPFEYVPPIFKGLAFSLTFLESEGEFRETDRVLLKGEGTIVPSGQDSSADWVIVPLFKKKDQDDYDAQNPKVVTACWLEQCLHENRLLSPHEDIIDRPQPYHVPVIGADNFHVSIAGYDEVTHEQIKRFIKAIGGQYYAIFQKSGRSHLIHRNLDIGQPIDHLIKAQKALQWGIPVLGFREFKRLVLELALRSETQFAKDDKPQPLQGCVIMIAPNETSQRSKDLLTDLGAVVAKDSSVNNITHYICAAKRPGSVHNAKERKKFQSSGAAVVHAAWLDECLKTGRRVAETDFPYTYDLVKAVQMAAFITASPPDDCKMLATPASSLRTSQSHGLLSPSLPRQLSHLDEAALSSSKIQPPNFAISLDPESATRELGPSPATAGLRQDSQDAQLVLQPAAFGLCCDDSVDDLSLANVQQSTAVQVLSNPLQRCLLKEQTSALLAELEEFPVEETYQSKRGKRRNRAASRSRSLVLERKKSIDSGTKEDKICASGKGDSGSPCKERRRVPGIGIQPSQLSQWDEDSMVVRYEDPVAARAKADILKALGGHSLSARGQNLKEGGGELLASTQKGAEGLLRLENKHGRASENDHETNLPSRKRSARLRR